MKNDRLNQIINSESSNSVTSEGEYTSVRGRDFFAHKSSYEAKDLEFVGNMQQPAADKNAMMKKRYTCRVCGLVFASEDELRKHVLVNPGCAVKGSEVFKHKDVKQGETKQTARKSFPSSHNNSTGIIKNEMSVSNQKLGHNSPSQVASGTKSAGNNGTVGSARKSSQDLLAGQAARSNQDGTNMSCSICCLTFPDVETLQAHQKVHSMGKGPGYASKCPVCFQIFNNAFLLFSHQKKHQHWGKSAKCKTSGSKCPFCDKVFLYVRSRNAHLRGHDDVASENIENFLKKTTCEVCSLAFVSESQKIQHRKAEHPDWTDALPKLFSNFDLRNQDNGKRSHDQKKVVDHKPEASSKKVKVLVNVTPSLKAKLKAHPNTGPICFKQYSTTFVRNRHFRMHILDKAFECKWCTMKFHRSEPLNTHMQREHNDKLAFECLVCNLRYLTKFRVLQHVTKSHNSQTPQKFVKEREVLPPPSDTKKNGASFKNGNISKTESNGSMVYEDKGEYGKSKNNQEFYCEVCETSFLKLCGLQRHRQSKNHKDILATKDPQAACDSKKDELMAAAVHPAHAEQQDMSDVASELTCSVCLKLFTGAIEFVPHRLSHFHHTGLSEITELNPYVCEICTAAVDHHQKVQWHLLHHLQTAKAKQANWPQWKFSFIPRNYEVSPVKITNVSFEKPLAPVQVAKKSANQNRTEKPVAKETAPPEVHRNIFTCSACNVVFTTKHHYSAHIRRYCPVRKAAVSPDNQMEVDKSLDDMHTNWHDEDYPKLPCHYCSLEFGTADELGWHQKDCRKANGPDSGCLEDDVDDFFYCKVCECLFPFDHSYREHRELFCFGEESLQMLLSNSTEDKNLNRLMSAIEREAAIASCVRCNLIFLSVQKLNEHMVCHATKPRQHSVPRIEDRNGNTETKFQQPKVVSKTSENSGKVSFNIVDILSDSTTSKKTENLCSAGKTDEIGRLAELADAVKKEENDDPSYKMSESGGVADLRTEFAELLYILVADHELMEQLGWGNRPIDLVLSDVLEHMGLDPVASEQVKCDSDKFRQNIRILLETCISDDIMTNVSGGSKPVDSLVTEVLHMCRAQANNVPALPNLVTR